MLIEGTLVFDGVSGFFLDYSMIIINRGAYLNRSIQLQVLFTQIPYQVLINAEM